MTKSFWNYTVGVIKPVKTLFKKCHSWSNVLMAYGLVFSFFFCPRTICAFSFHRVSRGLMEQDKLSAGFSSRQSTLSLTDSSFIYPFLCLIFPSLPFSFPKHPITEFLKFQVM